ncbi:MAG: hypothetical protein M1825_003219 [Sarcosagium campestre]|nr:MAG: hypothetical protein M1825_003219 [Sarcosagium campestre]
MSAWRREYLEALQIRDRREKANIELISAFTKLADKAASLESPAKSNARKTTDVEHSEAQASTGKAIGSRAVSNTEIPTPSTDRYARMQVDLAEAQRTKVDLEARLNLVTGQFERLKDKSRDESKLIGSLSHERNGLIVRVRDRDEELRGKAKLLENVQDEMISLNLQLNMAEERLKASQKENKELVDRWMARMGREADAMNDASKFS